VSLRSCVPRPARHGVGAQEIPQSPNHLGARFMGTKAGPALVRVAAALSAVRPSSHRRILASWYRPRECDLQFEKASRGSG